jgi:hypothetical protein
MKKGKIRRFWRKAEGRRFLLNPGCEEGSSGKKNGFGEKRSGREGVRGQFSEKESF